MIVLGIETSCDDTSCAVVKDRWSVLSNVCSSQKDIHAKYGGVVPELASRRHVNVIDVLTREALERAGITTGQLDAIAVTYGPGLLGSLIVGVSFAKALAYSLKIPVVKVNHLEGHIVSSFLNKKPVEGSFIALTVSGGHTNLYYCKGIGDYTLLGRTIDDAAGEALDKAAKMMGLGYPGGPVIDKLSTLGNHESIEFPRPIMRQDSFNFSFSGLKTALYLFLQKEERKRYTDEDICASYQQAVVDCLVGRTKKAVEAYRVSGIVIGGGVSANSRLREELAKHISGVDIYLPDLEYCGDNAAMIAAVGTRFIESGMSGSECAGDDICPDPSAKLLSPL